MVELRICPGGCGRLTWPKRKYGHEQQIHKADLTPEELAYIKSKGAVQATLIDGTCTMCWQRSRPKPIPKAERYKMREEDLRRSQEAVIKYWLDRKARGVPRGGKSVTSLGNGGLFLKDVV